MPDPADPETATDPLSDPAAEAEEQGLADTLYSGDDSPGDGPSRMPGQQVDRYLLLEELGKGGMGVVVAAYDPDLDRKVALKFLHRGELSTSGQARLLREAQAMAKLAHPNVVTVFDVGVHDGAVFIAMELVGGGTLKEQVKAGARSWEELWPLFRQAASGLGAAHDAGIVHRDFKPANVLLDDAGRARVTDFGIARALGGDDTEPSTESSAKAFDASLTETGAVVGTPGYMAPEQHTSSSVDARTDQFAFCVALYEALYGERPFAGKSIPELAVSTSSGDVRPAPDGAAVPAWRREILSRGLSADPAARWPSMEALTDALDFDPVAVRRARWRMAGAAVLVVAVVSAFVGLARVGGGKERSVCAHASDHLAGVWDSERSDAVDAAFRGTDRPNAAEVFGLVDAGLTSYSDSWVRARTEACKATHERGEQSEAALDVRMQCLDRRLGQLGALVDVLAQSPDAALLDKATSAVASLRPVGDCADVEALSAVVRPPDDPATRTAVADLRARIDRANALHEAGRIKEGRAIIDAAAKEAEAVGYSAVIGEAFQLLAKYQREDEAWTDAEKSLRVALAASARAHDDNTVAAIWANLLYSLADQKRFEELEQWTLFADAAVERAGSKPSQRALVLWSRAAAAHERGDYDEARELYEQASVLYEEELGPDHPNVAKTWLLTGMMADNQGKREEAIAINKRALASMEKNLGPNHISVGKTHYQVAQAMLPLERTDESERHFTRALAIFESVYGPESAAVAMGHNGLGNVNMTRGTYDEAMTHFERAAELFEKAFGPDDFRVGIALTGIGNVLDLMDRSDEAFAPLERAVAIASAHYGPAHPRLATPLHNLGDLCYNVGRLDEAEPYLNRALAIKRESLGAEHPAVASSTRSLAKVYLAKGARAKAVRFAEDALAIDEKHLSGDALRRSQWVLAKALAAAGGNAARARELAMAARRGFENSDAADDVAQIDAWLEAHR